MYKYLKRFFDIFFAAVLLIVLIPLFIILGILIKADSKGPVFYIQKRSGKNNKTFNLYKFRTMTCDNDYKDFSCEDRITKVGNFLRKCSIDELPQLLNILKGEMSFIGPRPWVVEYSTYFTPKQFRRLDVLPGITGLAQSSGRNNLSILDKIKYDIKYVDNLSLKLDIHVVHMTATCLFRTHEIAAGKKYISNELDDLKNNYSKYINRHKKNKKKVKNSKKKVMVKV